MIILWQRSSVSAMLPGSAIRLRLIVVLASLSQITFNADELSQVVIGGIIVTNGLTVAVCIRLISTPDRLSRSGDRRC